MWSDKTITHWTVQHSGKHTTFLVLGTKYCCKYLISWTRKVLHLLASFNIITPHQMLQPQPTRQNMMENTWAAAIIMLMQKAFSRSAWESLIENLGFPTHKQNIPLNNVPENKIYINEYFQIMILWLWMRMI